MAFIGKGHTLVCSNENVIIFKHFALLFDI